MQALIPGSYSTISAPKSLVDGSERRRLRLSDPADRDDLGSRGRFSQTSSVCCFTHLLLGYTTGRPRFRSPRCSRIRRRSENAAASFVRPPTDPNFAVGTG